MGDRPLGPSKLVLLCDWVDGSLIVVVMERDQRMTGAFRGQSDAVEAPQGFDGTTQILSCSLWLIFLKSAINGRSATSLLCLSSTDLLQLEKRIL